MLANLGILILRVVVGAVLFAHGSQKMLGWFGGNGLKGTISWLGKTGARPAWFWGFMAALTEFGGGLLLILGFLSPLGSLGIIASMLTAIITVHWTKGFWSSKGGYEFPLVNLAAALALALTGPGAYSLDAILKISLPEPAALIIGLVLVVLGELALPLSQGHLPFFAGHHSHA